MQIQKIFELLKITFQQRKSFERYRIIVFDEISTGESISIDSQNLTYKSLVDFGENEIN